jgi:hypothetical protein
MVVGTAADTDRHYVVPPMQIDRENGAPSLPGSATLPKLNFDEKMLAQARAWSCCTVASPK